MELCDHPDCPAAAGEAYVLGDLELTFCRHHSRELQDDLLEEDFELVEAPGDVNPS